MIRLGVPLLAVCVAGLGYYYWQSRIRPYAGYGEDTAALEALKAKDPRALSGGDLTHFKFGTVSFETPAINLPWQLFAGFDAGDGLFERKYRPAVPGGYGAETDGLGPLYNMDGCEGCHIRDGRAAPPQAGGEPLRGLLFRVSVPGTGPHGSPNPHPVYGGQLADKAIDGVVPEVSYRIDWQEVKGLFGDGTPWSLSRPVYSFPLQNYGPLGAEAMISPRIAPFMIGMGLLDAITEESILERADVNDKDGDGISGKANLVWSVESQKMRVGKFGWKAETPTLAHQAMDAAVNDMGITNPLFPAENCTEAETDCRNALSGTTDAPWEMTPEQMSNMVTYMEFLGVPGRDWLNDPWVQKGERLFKEAGCESCHRETFLTGREHRQQRLHNQTIHPYTDLLLHDMGPELADNRPSFDADGQEWRTAPLWGIGMVERVNGHSRFLHDGRARNLEEAILWHGGEAENAKKHFVALERNDREALIRFLKSI